MQNSFKVIGGLDDQPYWRLNSETEIDRVNIKLRKQLAKALFIQKFSSFLVHINIS